MKYTLHENLSQLSGTVSNLHGFMYRNLDSSFPAKWSGYWSPPYKFLDYYAYRINGLWLDSNSVECTEYGEKIVHHYSTDSLSIREIVKTPERLPGFRSRLVIENNTGDRKAVHVALEIGIDIREKSDDIGPEDYKIETGSNRLTAKKGERKLMVSSSESFEIKDGPYTKIHYPGEEQRCVVPGKPVFRIEVEPGKSKEIEVDYTTSDASFRSLEKKQQQLEHSILGRIFNDSIDSMINLVYGKNGTGVIAGHPWFQSYWARDTFWTLLGLIDAGYFELSREILENFAGKDIPSKIELESSDEESFPRADTCPLFIIAADKLERHDQISEKIKDAMEDAMENLEIDEDGVVQHDPEGSWMDTLERSPAVDIQALWLEAARIMDREEGKLESGLEKFDEKDYMKDFLGEDSPRTINPAVPLMFGQLESKKAEKYLEKINGEFSSMYGARTRSMADPGYESGGYHTGSVWGLTTGWAAAANLEYGKEKQGVNMLEKLGSLIDDFQPGALPEVVDAENGSLLGCPEQAWSAGMMAHVIDTYLLGIEVKSDRVVIDPPQDFSGKRTGKRVRDEKLDLEFREGNVKVLNDPGIEVDIK